MSMILKFNIFKEPPAYITIILMIPSAFFISDTILLGFLYGIQIIVFWSYVKNYSNSLEIHKNDLVIKNYLRFKRKITISKNDIKEIKINAPIKERRKYNIKITTKSGSQMVFFFQKIDDQKKVDLEKAWQ